MALYSTRLFYEGLRNGDRLSQSEFHFRYELAHEEFRAELIDGVVYVREPIALPHSKNCARLVSLFDAYAASTEGVEAGGEVSVILGKKDEVQPDAFLRVTPACKGQSKDSLPGKYGSYILGAPELVAEVAYSSRSIDLHIKRKRYERAGVVEYVVVCLESNELLWFDLRKGKSFAPDKDGVLRSRAFPGLWINPAALLEMDYRATMKVLNRGLSSKAHAEFVDGLVDS